ncbi:jg16987 [Pararge aegeria aegeria]|uniref:Jg16987 protein n=1 Tax=Pararge aegeria aegeria TaxID=348720 RepID=A0A8S4QEL9_9NEOP|nr:jg16987 [Pararge aegeria aegeria]
MKYHINYLELLAVFMGLKSFSSQDDNCAILLRVDNTTAISYINCQGGIQFPHLNDLTRCIWQWCEKRNIWMFASYVNTKDNYADEESRKINPDIELELSDNAYKIIKKHFGCPDIDLFASRVNAKCDLFVSWKQEPDAYAVDAFTLNWQSKYFFAFPPFSLILKCLRKGIPPPAQQTYPGCREALRTAFTRRGTPPEALNLMMASLADNTIKQYNVTLKLWWQFCSSHNIDVFNGSISDMLSFLTHQFNNGCSYGSLNSHRSALSLLLTNFDVGSDVCIKRLLKGAYKIRPNKPKYTSTWDPQLVLNHVSNWYPNLELSIEKITKKLVILLALCTAHRVQTFSLIKMKNVSITQTGVKIAITDIIKTSAPRRDQPILSLPFFRDNINICPASVLKDYIFVTKNMRTPNVGNLLLTFKKPHKATTAQSISRWIKQVISESGVDVNTFSAHSIRHAATSAAYHAGLSLDTIRKTAGWSSTSLAFARFYNRPILTGNDDFANAVVFPVVRQ